MKSGRAMSIAVILMGFANLVLITTKPVNRILSWCFALFGVGFFILSNIMYAKEKRERTASVYSDWDKGLEPVGFWGSDPDLTINLELDFVAEGESESLGIDSEETDIDVVP